MTRRTVPGVPAWPDEPGGRDGAVAAVRAVLVVLGRERRLDELRVLSGAAFRWCHVDRDGFDPGREPPAPDVVTRGLAAAGVPGRWLLDRPFDEVRRRVSGSLVAGRPALAVDVPGYPVRGFAVLAGEDDGRGTWHVQGSFEMGAREWNEGGAYWECAVRDDWAAPVPGRSEAAGNPVFLLDEPGPAPDPHLEIRRAIRDAIRDRGATGGDPPTGTAAWEALIEDVLLGRRFVEGDRIRRLDAALAGLALDRGAAASLTQGATAEAAARFAEVAGGASSLRRRILAPRPPSLEPEAIADAVENGEALAVRLGRLPGATLDALRGEGLTIAETPLGPVVDADTPTRRGAAARMAAGLRDLDEEAFELLSPF
jgi:hypothetical protein